MFGVGSSQVGIGLAIRLHDQFSHTARSVQNEMNGMKRSATSMAQAQYSNALALGAGIGAVGIGVSNFFASSFKAYADYDYTMTKVGIITKGTTEQMVKLNKATSDLALNTKYTKKEIAGSALEGARAGLSAQEIIPVNKAAAQLALITGTKLNKSMEIGTDIMTAFGYAAEDAEIVFSKLAMGTNAANMDFTQMGAGMKYAAAAARMAGYNMEEVLATIGGLSNVGLKGSMAGTTTLNFITKLSTAISRFRTTKQASVLDSWGLSPDELKDSKGRMKGLIEVMGILGKKFKAGASVPEFDALLGKRGGRVMLTALGDQKMGKSAEGILKELMDPSKVATYLADATDKINNSAKGRMDLMASAWDEFKTTMGETIAPLLTPLIRGLTKVLNLISRFSKTGIGKFFVMAVASAGVLLTIMGGILTVVGAIGLASMAWGRGLALVLPLMKSILNVSKLQAMVDASQGFSNVGGRTRNTRSGRFMKRRGGSSMLDIASFAMGARGSWIGKAGRGMAKFGKFLGPVGSMFGSLLRFLGPVTKILGFLGSNLLRFAGPIGIIASIVLMFVDLEDIIEGFMYVVKGITSALWDTWNGIASLWRSDDEQKDADLKRRIAMGDTKYKDFDQQKDYEENVRPWEYKQQQFRTGRFDYLKQKGQQRNMAEQALFESMNTELKLIKQHLSGTTGATLQVNVDGENKINQVVDEGMSQLTVD